MRCLVCNETVTWRHPIVYIGYNRGIHVDEFVNYIEKADLVRKELLGERQRLVMDKE